MKCLGCKAELTKWNPFPLMIMCDKSVIQCPICNYVTELCYNRRRERWETRAEYDERKQGWKKGGNKT